jgi:hypothetical protein
LEHYCLPIPFISLINCNSGSQLSKDNTLCPSNLVSDSSFLSIWESAFLSCWMSRGATSLAFTTEIVSEVMCVISSLRKWQFLPNSHVSCFSCYCKLRGEP